MKLPGELWENLLVGYCVRKSNRLLDHSKQLLAYGGGAEAAIHSMKLIFGQDSTDGVILVDVGNAFNSLNRKAALHNIRIICPEFSTVLINTYRRLVRMFIEGGGEILSVLPMVII